LSISRNNNYIAIVLIDGNKFHVSMVISLVLGKVNSKSTDQYEDIKDIMNTTSTHTIWSILLKNGPTASKNVWDISITYSKFPFRVNVLNTT